MLGYGSDLGSDSQPQSAVHQVTQSDSAMTQLQLTSRPYVRIAQRDTRFHLSLCIEDYAISCVQKALQGLFQQHKYS